MGECSYCMTFHRYSMLVDLVVESYAKSNGVAGAIFDRRTLGMIWGKTKAKAVELCYGFNYVV